MICFTSRILPNHLKSWKWVIIKTLQLSCVKQNYFKWMYDITYESTHSQLWFGLKIFSKSIFCPFMDKRSQNQLVFSKPHQNQDTNLIKHQIQYLNSRDLIFSCRENEKKNTYCDTDYPWHHPSYPLYDLHEIKNQVAHHIEQKHKILQ